MTGTGEKRLTEAQFIRGLDLLSKRIASNPIFTPKMLPLKFISLGGFVSVCYLRCRNTTEDLDFYYPGTPSVDGEYEYPDGVEAALESHIKEVGHDLTVEPNWANSGVSLFIEGWADQADIISRSFDQNVMVYGNNQLQIFAASWTLQLIQKINAIGSRRQDHDKVDAAYIAERIFSQLGRAIKKSELYAEWSQANRMEEIMDNHIQLVNEASRGLFNKDVVEIDI
ncbi:hypothetical protein B0H14DRAFT_2867666 [Mycena olivaceomarginata]|nr:hypothetical protein B0H14DRAFT_2867666 [Mycena olivaceomarginata]